MSESLLPSTPADDSVPASEPPLTLHLPRPVILGSFVVILGFLGVQTPRLWGEFSGLRKAWAEEAETRVVAYRGVGISPSYARPPENWYRQDGKDCLLWAGWNRKTQVHHWFRLEQGDIDPDRISHSIGRDTLQAIQAPIFEGSRGEYWDRIHLDQSVYVWDRDNEPLAFPEAVLAKVGVVNARHLLTPMLVVYYPFDLQAISVQAYEPALGSQVFTFGNSGYLIDHKPILYDNQEKGLWRIGPDGLIAVSGPHKGSVLKRIGRLHPETWSEFREAHPEARVLVGAERSRESAR